MIYRIYSDNKLVDCAFNVDAAERKYATYKNYISEGYAQNVRMTGSAPNGIEETIKHS